VRKALYLILIAGAAFGQTPQPNDTVLAWNPSSYVPAGSGWPSLPYATWTNSTAWYAFPASLYPTAALDASPVRSNGVYAGSGCGTFDGAADVIQADAAWNTITTNSPSTGYVEVWVKPALDDTARIYALFSSRNSTSPINTYRFEAWLQHVSGRWNIRWIVMANNISADNSYTQVPAADTIKTNEFNLIRIYQNGTGIGVLINGVDMPVTIAGRNDASAWWDHATIADKMAIGASNPNSLNHYYKGEMAGLRFCDTNDNCLINFPISENWGTTIHETIAGKNGTLTTGVGGQATFWGGTQDEVHWNLTRGHAAWTDGTNTTRVPYLANMSGPAATNVVGSTLIEQRPASFVHNKAETTIDGFSYSNLITNALWAVTTNAAGMIMELKQP